MTIFVFAKTKTEENQKQKPPKTLSDVPHGLTHEFQK